MSKWEVGALLEMQAQVPFVPPEVTSWMPVIYRGDDRGRRIVELPNGETMICHGGIKLRPA